MKGICINCTKRKELYCQKRQLCKTCYGKWYNQSKRKDSNMLSKYKGDKIQHSSEVEFTKFFTHNNWKYHPCHFRFNGEGYQPDFYDGERNMFIEVVGTRQAFSANKEKYKKFIATYPKINFEIRLVNGDLIDLEAERQPQGIFSEK